jgi:biotin carboxylase
MTEEKKPLLLLASTKGYETRLFIDAARNLGIPIALGTDRCGSLDDPWNDRAIPLRFEDPEASARTILDFAREQPVQAIVPLGDHAVRTAALACRALDLPHNPPEAAEAARNKYKARQKLKTAGVAVPPFARFSLQDDPRRCAQQVAYPCVLKPLSLAASQGVIRADTPGQFLLAFERIRALMQRPEVQVHKEESTDWLLAEGFIPGREVAVEGLLDRGRLRVLALFDKPDPLDGPFFEETIYVTPSREDAARQAAIVTEVERAARALALFHGPIHAEVRLSPDGPRIVEVAARAIGGLCSRVLRFRTGLSLPELILAHACDLPVEPATPDDQAAGVMMIPIPTAGIYEGVDGLDAALQVPGIEDLTITAKEDHPILPRPEGASYLGFIFARGSAPDKVEHALRAAHQCLRFRITTRLPVDHPLRR